MSVNDLSSASRGREVHPANIVYGCQEQNAATNSIFSDAILRWATR